MPMYDFKCEACQHQFDALRPVGTPTSLCPMCGGDADKVWLPAAATVIGDEIDIVQENGFRHPQHFTSRSERRRVLKEAGLEEMVRHVDGDGLTRSHTQSWASIGAGTLESARAMLERVGGAVTSAVEPPDDVIEQGTVIGADHGVRVTVGRTYSGVLDPEDMKVNR